MNPQQSQHGRDTRVEAIDLTLSSPEPEVEPRYRANNHMQQHHPATAFKQEPRSSSRSVQCNSGHAQRQGSSHVPRQHSRHINPKHIKQMIDSSSHRVLRHVVLQLCQQSEALSGALVRGLAPHSPWAQALMREQQTRSRVRTQHPVKTEARVSSQGVSDHMRKRPGPSSAVQSSSSHPRSHHQSAAHQSRDSLRLPPTSQNSPAVKHERQISPTDSDDSTHIVGFPTTGRVAPREERVQPSTASSSSNYHSHGDIHAGNLAIRQNSIQVSAADKKAELCSQCHEYFDVSERSACYYHTGHKLPTRPGDVPQYSCCSKFVGEPGCSVGRHNNDRSETFTSHKRPSPSHYDGSPWSKRPRAL